MRSYQLTCTGSHQNSEVKRVWARVVLGWVTSWEVLVLHPFFFSSLFLCLFRVPVVAGVCFPWPFSSGCFSFFTTPWRSAAIDRLKPQGETRSSGIREEELGEPEGLCDKTGKTKHNRVFENRKKRKRRTRFRASKRSRTLEKARRSWRSNEFRS